MLSDIDKAYIAGFLDGDGCVMFQLVRRKDYVYGFQIRASVVFYQKTKHRAHLEWIKLQLKYGYLRDRKDGMSEYTIVGIEAVRETLQQLAPFLHLKKPHALLAEKIFETLPKRFNPERLIAVGTLVDQFKELNYSKRRQNTSATLRQFFCLNRLYIPVTTDSEYREGKDEMVRVQTKIITRQPPAMPG